jgi:uncharacterized membrane protein YeaQ/YmgE (transglycosylase-associated protein family)
LAASTGGNVHGRSSNRLDRSNHHWWYRRLARRAVHEESNGTFDDILLGIVGAAIAGWLFGLFGVSFGTGWLGYLIAGFMGACILIFIVRAIRERA